MLGRPPIRPTSKVGELIDAYLAEGHSIKNLAPDVGVSERRLHSWRTLAGSPSQEHELKLGIVLGKTEEVTRACELDRATKRARLSMQPDRPIEPTVRTNNGAVRNDHQRQTQNLAASPPSRTLRLYGVEDASHKYTDDLFRISPKLYATGKFVCPNMCRIIGNDTSTLTILTRYKHEYLTVPEELKPYYIPFINKVRHRSKKFWNGPICRLTHCDERSTPNEDCTIVTLHLSPAGWFDYTALNQFLDYRLPGGETIGERFAPQQRVLQNTSDFRWSPLCSMLGVGLVPITTDGYGVFQLRDPRGTSAHGDLWTTGVAESMHRYWDEAVNERPARQDAPDRLHRLLPRGQKLGPRLTRCYEPLGIPHPLLTAQRGVHEELSERLATEMAPDQYHFLNIGWSFPNALPTLIGVIDTGKSLHQIQEYIRSGEGVDHAERKGEPGYIFLDRDHPDTAARLSNPSHWVPTGLAALMSAINYVE